MQCLILSTGTVSTNMIDLLVCGVGVCVFVSRDVLSYRTLGVLLEQVEMVCVTIIVNKNKFNAISVYRKPGKTTLMQELKMPVYYRPSD
jgi:hypothetical protein